ncbi:MAG: class B sortase [Lachnospiraceae bacterium]|nr:class B sortase [Lachnospiraceae bacterium]
MSSEWSVEGYSARNKSEYEAFLRDSKKISEIKKKINFNKASDVNKLYSAICTGGIKFESRLGFDFEDEITDIYEKLNKKTQSSSSKKSDHRSRYTEDDEDELYSDYIKSHQKVENSDENVDKELVEYYINRQRKQKNLFKYLLVGISAIVVLGSVIAVMGKVVADKRTEKILREIEESNRDNAFIFTTINPNSVKKNNTASNNSDTNDYTITFDTYEIPDILEKYKDTYTKNNDLIGWIKISDTNIDYPVVQSNDNQFYLSHNFKGKGDANGCIFADMYCNIYPRSKNVILYGHHMKSGKMFAHLEKYDNYDFYLKHKTFVFDTIFEEAMYEIVFVFRDYVRTSDATDFKYYEFVDVTSEIEFDSYMNELKEKSLYDTNVPVKFDDELLTLSTCDYAQANGRFVVIAKKIK